MRQSFYKVCIHHLWRRCQIHGQIGTELFHKTTKRYSSIRSWYSQLIWYWKEGTKTIEQWNRARNIESSQDQLFGVGKYTDLQRQSRFDDDTLVLHHIAAFNAWDSVKESGKRTKSFTKIIQAPEKPSLIFTMYDFTCK